MIEEVKNALFTRKNGRLMYSRKLSDWLAGRIKLLLAECNKEES